MLYYKKLSTGYPQSYPQGDQKKIRCYNFRAKDYKKGDIDPLFLVLIDNNDKKV